MTTLGHFPVHSPKYDTITFKLLSVVKRTFLDDYIILFGNTGFSSLLHFPLFSLTVQRPVYIMFNM